MDKYEYKVRSEEISDLIDKEKYTEAVKIADTIDWRRVKSAGMLLKIAALYRINRRNEDSREMLMLAYDRYPTNRSVVYSLCELSIELDDVVAAIEYYKQFAKLAPKDNGVYTLRYRILEAQEASLEERIEILEELKKRDYQEEWAYELAYLYHRVGLSTKCVEECDDIILWFGDGPYVMKAMELKALHMPLTEVQQKKYEMMMTLADNNYSEDSYQEDYSNQNYSNQDYSNEEYSNEEYPNEEYPDETYQNEDYQNNNYESGNYDAQNGYIEEPYNEESYNQESYNEESYNEEFYGNETYDQEGYTEEPYTNDAYTQNGYVDDGYGNLSYVDNSYQENSYQENGYQDNSYTGEFYVEQTYDENGNPIDFSGYADGSYAQESYDNTGYGADSNYAENDYNADAYGNNSYTDSAYNASGKNNIVYMQPQNSATSSAAGDMSQYNTINLQKVVAESMRELFPDDDDIFAEDREKYNAQENVQENISSEIGDTRIYSNEGTKNAINKNAINIETTDTENPGGEDLKLEAEPQVQTGRIAQLVTSVSEAAPEPDTGAIKKVLIPGEDARLIKEEADMDELRDTTERTVVEEQSRMEYNDENVYHEQSLMDTEMTGGTVSNQTTGSMNLDNVLVEWERMKLDNAKKHQEEIKQHVLTQTGKILANFDNSIKSGILGELERDEAEAQRKNAPKSKHSDNGFLEADDTDDIPQNQLKPESEDAFDVSYVSDKPKHKNIEPEKTEADAREEYITELGRVVAQELGGQTSDIPQEPIHQVINEDPTVEDAVEENLMQENLMQESLIEESLIEENPIEEDFIGENPIEEDFIEEGLEEDLSEENLMQENPEMESTMDLAVPDDALSDDENYADENDIDENNAYDDNAQTEFEDNAYYDESTYAEQDEAENGGYYEDNVYAGENQPEDASYYEETEYTQSPDDAVYYEDNIYQEESEPQSMEYYEDSSLMESNEPVYDQQHEYKPYQDRELDPEDAESIAEMAKEDALKTQEIKMNTADLSALSEKIVATTKKEASGAKREEVREFTPEEQTLFENFAVTKKIKKQIVFALDNITLAAYTGNIIITGDAGLDTVRMAKNLIKEYQASDANFSGRLAKITGEKINQRNIKDVFEKLNNGGIIIEKANGMSEEKLYEMALNLNQENLGIVVIMEDTKKEITKLLEKQAMIADYFNIRIDLMEMDNNALVAYAKNYALALEYSIDELGTLALYTRIANMQSGNHVVTKDEVRDIIDEAIWKSKKSKIKNFVDVLFARRYDNEDMIVLKERDFM